MFYQNANDHLVDRFEDWWRCDTKGLPLMDVVAIREGTEFTVKRPENPADLYLDTDYILAQTRERIKNCRFLADSYASVSADLGPGSMALYLGGEPRFGWDTVWFRPCIDDAEKMPELRFDPENKWWKRHLSMIRALKAEAGNDFLVNVPDILENMDIYAALRGTENALFDLMDYPDEMEQAINKIDSLYFRYFDEMYDIVRDENGISAFTVFGIIGRGKVAKTCCDFSAMVSPQQFRRFAVPGLRRQAQQLDHTLYHLDGPDAIKHIPALMEISEIDAIQWTCGAGQPDGASPRWYTIYDACVEANKGLWVQIYDEGIDRWIRNTDSLIDRYGMKRFYFHYPWMKEAEAEKLLTYAEKHWKA